MPRRLGLQPSQAQRTPRLFPQWRSENQEPRSHPAGPIPARLPVTLADPPHCRHILKPQGGWDTGPSRDGSRGQSCGIKEKKQSFPGGGRQKPRLLEADRNDQSTRMDGRGGGKEQQGRGRQRGSWGRGLLHDGLGL